MKKYILCFLFIPFIMSCSTLKPIETAGGFSIFSIDFTEYADSNFLFTPYGPEGDYLGLGEIQITLSPQVIEISRQDYQLSVNENNGVFFSSDGKPYLSQLSSIAGNVSYWGIEIMRNDSFKLITSKMHDLALSYGANAVVDLEISARTVDNLDLEYTVYDISGFAIERR